MNILNVKDGDERISFSNAGYNRLTIIISQRYCLALVPNDEHPWFFISQKNVPSTAEVSGGPFNGNPQAYGYESKKSDEMVKRLPEIASACEQELQRTKRSRYRDNNNPQFERATYDHLFRKQLFESAFGSSLNKTPLSLIHLSPPIMSDKLEFLKNTILYGPPGTGKTYRLTGYMKNHFTDKDITKTSDEILRERVTAYPFWKVLGAVLATSKRPLSVAEIIEHPIVKARVNPAIKTKVNNLAWADLQSYADDDSTQLVSKYRRSIKLFHKSDERKWSIAEDKKQDLADIIDQELLDIAASPAPDPIRGTSSKTRFNFITFHQKYSYEDFIEGIKPLLKEDTVEEQVGELQFELKKGIFYSSCLEALKLAGYESFDEAYGDTLEARRMKFEITKNEFTKQFALFIDEINRANISAVFGELITLLEEDKRMGAENEMWVELPYSNEKFCVPANLFVIGTMNTADRSIALLDIALRRRFEFIALYPIYDEAEWWSSLLEKINLAIYAWKKNPDFFIGHAFFINKPESDRLKILNAKIIPLLYEYCQNNGEKVKGVLTEAGISIRQTSIKENFQIIAE